MEIYESDDQQAEALKKWWRENGKQVILGAVLGLSLVFGWRAWESHVATVNAKASQALADMSGSMQQGKKDVALKQGQAILDDYPATVYADLAGMTLAKLHVDKGELDQAAELLRRVTGHAADPALVNLARLRLARVLLALKKHSEAEQALSQMTTQSYAAEANEIRGDIAVAKGDSVAAKSAYSKAMTGKQANIDQIELKMDNLATAK